MGEAAIPSSILPAHGAKLGLGIGTLFPPRNSLIIRYKGLTITIGERIAHPDSDLALKRALCASSRLTAFPANFSESRGKFLPEEYAILNSVLEPYQGPICPLVEPKQPPRPTWDFVHRPAHSRLRRTRSLTYSLTWHFLNTFVTPLRLPKKGLALLWYCERRNP